MTGRLSVDDWLQVEHGKVPDGAWSTMMARVAKFHHKHNFADDESHGHDMGFRIALTVEELGELSAAITKGKPDEEAAEELADLLSVVGDKSSAVKSYNAAISNDPTRISTYLKLAKVQNTASAFKTLFKALEHDSDNPFIHLRIAKLFLADSQESLACEHFNRAAEESIGRISSLRSKAKEALDGNQFHLSRSLEDQACEIAAHRAEALFQRGASRHKDCGSNCLLPCEKKNACR